MYKVVAIRLTKSPVEHYHRVFVIADPGTISECVYSTEITRAYYNAHLDLALELLQTLGLRAKTTISLANGTMKDTSDWHADLRDGRVEFSLVDAPTEKALINFHPNNNY